MQGWSKQAIITAAMPIEALAMAEMSRVYHLLTCKQNKCGFYSNVFALRLCAVVQTQRIVGTKMGPLFIKGACGTEEKDDGEVAEYLGY